MAVGERKVSASSE